MIPQSDIDNAAAGYGIGASNLTWKTPESQARIAFKAGCDWAMGKIRVNRDNAPESKETALPVNLPPTVWREDGEVFDLCNGMGYAAYQSRKDPMVFHSLQYIINSGEFSTSPEPKSKSSVDWAAKAVDEIFDKCVCSGDGQLFASK